MNVIGKLITYDRLKTTLLIFGTCLFALILVVFRIYKTGSVRYIFLLWNLVLASIPWLISSLLIIYPKLRKGFIFPLVFGGSWMLFLPNTFYILTDLFHLNSQNAAPVWYDLVLIFTHAWAGLLFGFISLKDFETILGERIHQKYMPYILSGILFLSGFGVYIGRFLRWNSWNIINRPIELFIDVKEQFTNPDDIHQSWGMTVLIGVLLNLIWWSFHIFKNEKVKAF
jgi:uncharacterized membrane protein